MNVPSSKSKNLQAKQESIQCNSAILRLFSKMLFVSFYQNPQENDAKVFQFSKNFDDVSSSCHEIPDLSVYKAANESFVWHPRRHLSNSNSLRIPSEGSWMVAFVNQ